MEAKEKVLSHHSKLIPLELQSTINNSRSFAVFFATVYSISALFALWALLTNNGTEALLGYLLYYVVMAALNAICAIKLVAESKSISNGWSVFTALLAIPTVISIVGIFINVALWGNVIRINKYNKQGREAFQSDEEWLGKRKKLPSVKRQTTTAIIVGTVLAMFVCGLVAYNNGLFGSTGNSFAGSPSELATQAVAGFKADTVLPYEVDEVTTLNDVTSTGNLVEYYYMIHGADTSNLSNEILKNTTRPNVCSNDSAKALLDEGVAFSYYYTVRETGEKYYFSVFSADC